MNSKCRLVPIRSTTLLVVLALLVLSPTSQGQETEPPALPVSEAQDYLGEWALEMKSPQGTFDADLAFNAIEGRVVAELGMPRFGNRTIDEIARTEGGLRLTFQTTFGEQSFDMILDVARRGEGLEGGLAEANGLFQIPFKGITRQAFLAGDTSEGDRQRRRGRGTGGSGETRLTLAEKEIRVRFDRTKISDDAYKQVSEPREGRIVIFVSGRPSKLWTDVDLRFGETVIETENVAEDYPGVYSLWLKRVGDSWHLVFNELPDVWGTQHDPSHDIAEVPLVTVPNEEESEDLTFELQETERGGVLRIGWGGVQWQAPFTVEAEARTEG